MSASPRQRANWKAETAAAPDPEALARFAGRWGLDADSPRLRTALTHRSAVPSVAQSNERLEFLGDAVLGFLAAEFLLEALPGVPEGTLSRARQRLVREETVANAARALGLDRLLIVGSTEERNRGRGRDSLLGDVYEAVVGALFLERGPEAARAFVRETLAGPMADVAASPPEPDPKTQLQIVLQSQGRGLPTYRDVSQSGPDHAKRFVAEVLSGGQPLGRGEGVSKRAAQAMAAVEALKAVGPPEGSPGTAPPPV